MCIRDRSAAVLDLGFISWSKGGSTLGKLDGTFDFNGFDLAIGENNGCLLYTSLSYLRQKVLSTVEDLEVFLESSGKSAADYRSQMKPKEARSKVIDGILASRTNCKECKPVYEKYQKIFFKKTKEKFKQEHPEVARYARCV